MKVLCLGLASTEPLVRASSWARFAGEAICRRLGNISALDQRSSRDAAKPPKPRVA